MGRYIVVILLLSFCLSTMAQDKMVFPRLRIGITPSTLVYNFPGVQFSVDKRLNEYINITAEYGFIFKSSKSKSGYRFHPGLEILLARGKWISYVCGVNFTNLSTIGTRKVLSDSRNREFNYVSYKDVQNSFSALSISNSAFMKVTKRLFITVGAGIGSGRKTTFAQGNEVPGFRTTGNSPLTTTSAQYYIDLNFSYALSL